MAPKLDLLENDELLTWMAETPDYLVEIRRLDDAQVELMKAAQSTGASSEGVRCAGEKDIIMVESGESAHAAGADPPMAGGGNGRSTNNDGGGPRRCSFRWLRFGSGHYVNGNFSAGTLKCYHTTGAGVARPVNPPWTALRFLSVSTTDHSKTSIEDYTWVEHPDVELLMSSSGRARNPWPLLRPWRTRMRCCAGLWSTCLARRTYGGWQFAAFTEAATLRCGLSGDCRLKERCCPVGMLLCLGRREQRS